MEEIVFGEKIRQKWNRKNCVGVLNYTSWWSGKCRKVGDKPIKGRERDSDQGVASVRQLTGK